MPKQITIETFTYDELSPKAQENARDWWRNASASDNSHFEGTKDYFLEILQALGFSDIQKVHFSGFSSQGDGASFEARFKPISEKEIKAFCEAYGGAIELQNIAGCINALRQRIEAAQTPNKTSFTFTQRGHYVHSNTMSCDMNDEPDGMGEAEFIACEKLALGIGRALADWYYSKLEEANDYYYSDENVAENIIINEYEFTASGRRTVIL